MNKIPFAISQTSGVAIMPPNADATFTHATGGASVFAGVVVTKRGKPNTVQLVTPATLQKVLGEPIHPHSSVHFESYRHVNQALQGGNGYVVRVAPKGMRIPMLSLMKAKNNFEQPELFASSNPVRREPMGVGGAYFSIYVDDGDASTNRTLSMTKHHDAEGMYTLTLKQVDDLGNKVTLDSIPVSLQPDAVDDMGNPAYLPIALENNTHRLRAMMGFGEDALPPSYPGFEDQPFVGGSDGDITQPISRDAYVDAIKVLGAAMVNYTAILSLGCYDATALSELATLANDVRVDMFCDLPPNLMPAQAMQEASDQGFGGYAHICRYHFPYSCRDDFSGAQVVYGLSGDAFTAKAKGVAMVADVGGYHLSPAGQSRGIIQRKKIKPLPAAAEIDRNHYANSGINTVGFASDGAVMIDDALTTYAKKNYLRYQHVNSTLNAIARLVYEVGNALKNEPDGVTRRGLEREIPRLLDRFVASEALVAPRNQEDGSAPYVVTVTQDAFDMWHVKYAVCPTGVSRRIVAEPVLIP
ncbi:phage tail protein [Xenorhabdus sp. 42]|uniref:phage tail protein n=1 Tax=Xenorhabdus szentirmaii TaxID=290112 RepID=UPI0019CACA4C|nr:MULTISPECIES: phage tail protein [unclassified Xenorhabdus]MBD2782218.1 phage tail protein [Xenorhabdus sp. 38]MBD2819727.1 phage tail protein [Xenorhabdus sp. 42]